MFLSYAHWKYQKLLTFCFKGLEKQNIVLITSNISIKY